MLKEQIFITYYEKLSDFKSEMFFLDDQELIDFLNDYEINQAKLTQQFIMLYNKQLDSYIIWTEVDSFDNILNYFLNEQIYKRFIT